MPYIMSWLVEKRVIYTRNYGFLTKEEISIQDQEQQSFIQQSENLVHIITDGTEMTRADVSLRDLQKMQFVDVANLGWAIYISPSKMNRFFASVIMQLSKKRGRQFATLEEGLTFLQDMDDTLPPISMPDRSQIST